MSSDRGTPCHHCGLPVPRGTQLSVAIDGVVQPMCCRGCQAVAEMIVEQGLVDYYRKRETVAPRADEALLDRLDELRVYDDPTLQRDFVVPAGDRRSATLSIEGIRCAACAWLIERQLLAQEGVVGAHVNLAACRARVDWSAERTRLSDVIHSVDRLGYRASPFEPSRQEEIDRRAQRAALRRLGVAGLGMAQVMTFAVALYAGSASGIEPAYRDLLRWVSLLVATAVVVYAAGPFFRGALRDLRLGRLGMDVPVALALGFAYAASLLATVTGSGDVYFDSICMFTFFLGLARYLELRIRLRSNLHLRALAGRIPQIARRVSGEREELVPPRVLEVGDTVLIAPGEAVPADGRVVRGEGSVSEALLTGESRPTAKRVGDAVLTGSQNVDGELLVCVERVGARSRLSTILALLDRAASEKPRLARAADRVAGWFVGAVLASAAVVAAVWWQRSPDDALWITLSVLVVTCPCALSLATPAALAAATNGLAGIGFLVTKGNVLETLADVDHVVFDKTGTVTTETPRLTHVRPLRPHSTTRLIAIARELERHSHHPIARAIRANGLAGEGQIDALAAELEGHVESVHVVPNRGVCGEIGGHSYRLGSAAWAARGAECEAPERTQGCESGLGPDRALEKASWILLADEGGPLAWLGLQSDLRADAADTAATLRHLGISQSLVSGDPSAEEVRRIAHALAIEETVWGASPERKVAVLEARQAAGDVVAAIGDGINDAPLLGRAHVSVAMAAGSDIARVSADAVLLGDQLGPFADALRWSRRTRRIIRQNLGWALGYNLVALPLAACGFVPPYLAAAGMSFSSLLVVANALRLSKVDVAEGA